MTKRDEEAMNLLIDLKTKLHKDRQTMIDTKEQVANQLIDLETNIQIVEQRNNQIKDSLKAQEDMGGSNVTAENLEMLV